MNRSYAVAALLVAAACSMAHAEPGRDIAARTEVHAIQTLTLSDSQFLKGDADGQGRDHLRQAADRTGHRPAAGGRPDARLGRDGPEHRDVGARVQRDRHFHLCA